MEKAIKYDVVVVGAGPAGMMAAIAAAENGGRVVLIEKNASAGRKLLLTGGGRCNFTNNENDLRKLVANYGANGPFLFHAFSEFGPGDAIKFFNGLGIKTVVEERQRTFPASGQAADFLNALLKRLEELDVKIMYDSAVRGFEKSKTGISRAVLVSGERITAKNFIIAVGGKSYPATGSSGDGYNWASELGHKAVELVPGLVPVRTKEDWGKTLSGISLKNFRVTVFQQGKKIFSFDGEFIFTHFGLSGPAILDASSRIGKLLDGGEVSLSIDLFPAIDVGRAEKMLLDNFRKNPNRILKNCLADMMPLAMASVVSLISSVPPEKTANNITREERARLAKVIKDIRMTVAGLLDIEAGMVTDGGIALGEIDDKTMRSKIIKNLFCAGEIINVHGRTGGFNLQQSWSTGRLAGISASKK